MFDMLNIQVVRTNESSKTSNPIITTKTGPMNWKTQFGLLLIKTLLFIRDLQSWRWQSIWIRGLFCEEWKTPLGPGIFALTEWRKNDENGRATCFDVFRINRDLSIRKMFSLRDLTCRKRHEILLLGGKTIVVYEYTTIGSEAVL